MRFAPPKLAFYSLTIIAAALLLFTLLANTDDASAQQTVDHTPTSTSAPRAMTFSVISAGGHHTCGLRADGAAVCWGQNGYGRSTPPANETFASISAGGWHTCGLRADGTAVCWGYNEHGESSPPSGAFTSISAGFYHTCGLRADGSAVCWGSNGGRLPANETFTSISAGFFHTCGLRADGSAVCWGSSAAVPADETFTSISAGRWHACGLRNDGTAVCWGHDAYGESSPPSGVFSSISASSWRNTCGLRANGAAVCWGNNQYGQSTPPSGAFASISVGKYHACGLRNDGAAVCWGYNGDGRTSPPGAYAPTPTPITTRVDVPTNTPTTATPTLTPTSTSVSATGEPTPTSTSVSATGVSTPTPTSTPVTDAPAPTLTPTATGVSTPVGDGLDEFEEQVGALRDRAGTLQDMGTLNRLIESLRGLINALTDRVAELEGVPPTATPTATNTPVIVLEATPTPTATATSVPTATPTRVSRSTLNPGCIGKIGLGWLTGTWNADCLSDKTPATAKTGTRYARFYTFTLDDASSVTVSITSDDVADAYLYLLEGVGNAGTVVNRGDSRITEQLQAGSYTIEATTYNLQTGGNFMLTLDISTASVSR